MIPKRSTSADRNAVTFNFFADSVVLASRLIRRFSRKRTYLLTLISEEAALVKDTFQIQKSTDKSILWFVWLKMVISEQFSHGKIKDKDKKSVGVVTKGFLVYFISLFQGASYDL